MPEPEQSTNSNPTQIPTTAPPVAAPTTNPAPVASPSVIKDVETVVTDVVKDASSAGSIIKYAIIIIILVACGFSCSKIGCNPLKLLPNLLPNIKPVTTAVVDPTKPVTITPGHTIYTPPVTPANPHPTPVVINHPIEGHVIYNNGKITVTNIGFCFEPFIGYQYNLADGFRPYLSARVIYDDNLGLQVGLNDIRGFLGLDYRLPYINLVTIAGGGSLSYTGNLSPYLGLNAELRLQ